MITKIEGLLKLVVSNIPKFKGIRSLPIWVVVIFGAIFLTLHILFIVAWIDDWKTTGKPNLAMLDTFTKTTAGETVVIAFLATFLIDKNHNNIPDAAEKEISK